MIIFSGSIAGGSWVIENWFEPKTKPPSGNAQIRKALCKTVIGKYQYLSSNFYSQLTKIKYFFRLQFTIIYVTSINFRK